MSIYSAKSDTQGVVPGTAIFGPKLSYRICFARLLFDGWVIFCCQAPWCLMLESRESMIKISSRRGGGGRQTFFPSRFPEKFCAICRSFLFPEARAVL